MFKKAALVIFYAVLVKYPVALVFFLLLSLPLVFFSLTREAKFKRAFQFAGLVTVSYFLCAGAFVSSGYETSGPGELADHLFACALSIGILYFLTKWTINVFGEDSVEVSKLFDKFKKENSGSWELFGFQSDGFCASAVDWNGKRIVFFGKNFQKIYGLEKILEWSVNYLEVNGRSGYSREDVHLLIKVNDFENPIWKTGAVDTAYAEKASARLSLVLNRAA